MIFNILVPGSVTVGIPYLLLTSGAVLPYGIGNFRLIGIIFIAIGITFYAWTAWDFAFTGRGTPAPIYAPKMLVSTLLYRIVRNPMYVGVLLILLGEAILFTSFAILAYTLLVWLLFHLFVVYYEEPRLRKQFGAAYDEYSKVVPRWIPGLKGGRGSDL